MRRVNGWLAPVFRCRLGGDARVATAGGGSQSAGPALSGHRSRGVKDRIGLVYNLRRYFACRGVPCLAH